MGEVGVGWVGVGASVVGASHERAKKRNQDAIAWYPASQTGESLIVAVADGHGGERYVRSRCGAELAVEAAIHELRTLIHGGVATGPGKLSALSRFVHEHLPRRLCTEWERRVASHADASPLTEEELSFAGSPRIAYGCTVLAALVSSEYLIYLQLGDGDILEVLDDGSVSRPLTLDERLIGNETTSLASSKPWREVRVVFQPLVDSPPCLVLLSTDGYANSFRDDGAFLRVGSDLVEIIRSEGLSALDSGLKSWLEEASTAGSGDDVTVGVVWRIDQSADDQDPVETNSWHADDASAGPASVGDSPSTSIPESPSESAEVLDHGRP